MNTLEKLKAIREKAKAEFTQRSGEARLKVVVSMGTSGIAMGAREVQKAFLDEVAHLNLTDVLVTQTGEKGLSSLEPVVDVIEAGKETVTYGYMTPDKARRVVKEHLVGGVPVADFVISK